MNVASSNAMQNMEVYRKQTTHVIKCLPFKQPTDSLLVHYVSCTQWCSGQHFCFTFMRPRFRFSIPKLSLLAESFDGFPQSLQVRASIIL